MKLLIDANILLDVLQGREPHLRNSALIWKLCEAGMAEGWVSALSIANLVYVMRRELDPRRVEEILGRIGLIFRVADLTASDLAQAAASRWDDFEGALQSAAAARLHADFIITRNIRVYTKSRVPARTPAEFLAYM